MRSVIDKIGDLSEPVSPLLIKNSCCQRAFLRGAFLCIGSMSDPQKSYHLEFVCNSEPRAQALSQLPDAAWVALPVQLTDMELSRLTAQIAAHGLRVCLGSAGQLPVCPAPLMAGEGGPVWNALASDLLLAQGAQWQTLPRELTAREIAELLEKRPAAQLILPVYGRARLMYLNHCPARTALGLSGERQGCCLCAQGRGCAGQALTDRMGERFPLPPVRMDAGCLVQLLSCQVRSLSALASPKLHWLLDFTLEEPEEALRILRAYRALREGGSAEIPCFAERFDRGVE